MHDATSGVGKWKIGRNHVGIEVPPLEFMARSSRNEEQLRGGREAGRRFLREEISL